jgi:hypothetical protein
VIAITGSRDRDHARRHAPTDVLMLCWKWCFGQGLPSWVPPWMRSSGGTLSICAVFFGPFFGSTRAASILPSRPQFSQPHARRACQGWPRLRGHPLGLGLDRPEHGGRLDWSGSPGCRHLDLRCGGCPPHALRRGGNGATWWVQAFFLSPARRRKLSPLSWMR